MMAIGRAETGRQAMKYGGAGMGYEGYGGQETEEAVRQWERAAEIRGYMSRQKKRQVPHVPLRLPP